MMFRYFVFFFIAIIFSSQVQAFSFKDAVESVGRSIEGGVKSLEKELVGDQQQAPEAVVEQENGSEPVVEQKKTITKIPFTVKTTPIDARVRILNIGPAYKDGIQLAPGKYHVELSKDGYKKYTSWFELTSSNNELSINLSEDIITPGNSNYVSTSDNSNEYTSSRPYGDVSTSDNSNEYTSSRPYGDVSTSENNNKRRSRRRRGYVSTSENNNERTQGSESGGKKRSLDFQPIKPYKWGDDVYIVFEKICSTKSIKYVGSHNFKNAKVFSGKVNGVGDMHKKDFCEIINDYDHIGIVNPRDNSYTVNNSRVTAIYDPKYTVDTPDGEIPYFPEYTVNVYPIIVAGAPFVGTFTFSGRVENIGYLTGDNADNNEYFIAGYYMANKDRLKNKLSMPLTSVRLDILNTGIRGFHFISNSEAEKEQDTYKSSMPDVVSKIYGVYDKRYSNIVKKGGGRIERDYGYWIGGDGRKLNYYPFGENDNLAGSSINLLLMDFSMLSKNLLLIYKIDPFKALEYIKLKKKKTDKSSTDEGMDAL